LPSAHSRKTHQRIKIYIYIYVYIYIYRYNIYKFSHFLHIYSKDWVTKEGIHCRAPEVRLSKNGTLSPKCRYSK